MKKTLVAIAALLLSGPAFAGTKLLHPTNAPHSDTLPATCSVGDIYQDTDATSGSQWYACESANNWVLQGGGGGGVTVYPATAPVTISAAASELLNLNNTDGLGSSRINFKAGGIAYSYIEGNAGIGSIYLRLGRGSNFLDLWDDRVQLSGSTLRFGGSSGADLVYNGSYFSTAADVQLSSVVVTTQIQAAKVKFNDGTSMTTAASGSGSSSLAVSTGGVTVSSPTTKIDFRSDHFQLSTPTAVSVPYVEIASAAIGTAQIIDNDVGVVDLDQSVNGFASTGTANLLVAYSTTTGKFTGLTPLTTFYDTVDFGTPDFSSTTANTFDSSASTNPTFGRLRFPASLALASNCAFWTHIAPNDWNTSLDPRLNQFSVMTSSGTDNGSQEWHFSVSSIPANGRITTATYVGETTVFIPTSSGANPFFVQSATAPYVLGGWKATITPGMPYAVRGCRDATDATSDTSGSDSFPMGWQMRYAHTAPGE